MGFLLDLIVDLISSEERVKASEFVGKVVLKTVKKNINNVVSTIPFYNIIIRLINKLMKIKTTLKTRNQNALISIIFGDLLIEHGVAFIPQLYKIAFKSFKSKLTQSILNLKDKGLQAKKIEEIYHDVYATTMVYHGLSGNDIRKKLYRELFKDDSPIKEFFQETAQRKFNQLVDSISLVKPLRKIYHKFVHKEKEVKKQSVDYEWEELSSSWIREGIFFFTNKTAMQGNLTIKIRSIYNPKWYGPYTYPNVPFSVWNAMRNSQGHAGTVFWELYLHGWIASRLRIYIKKKIVKWNITPQNKNVNTIYNTQLIAIDNLIKKWSIQDFKRTKYYVAPQSKEYLHNRLQAINRRTVKIKSPFEGGFNRRYTTHKGSSRYVGHKKYKYKKSRKN